MRAPETGSRELVVIDIPHDGYSVEYLQAVVKSAKVYIRPLQKDLDLTPFTKQVWYMYNTISFVHSRLGHGLYKKMVTYKILFVAHVIL